MTGFCDAAWQETERLRAEIHDLPFNRELAAGSLTEDRFQFYMVQDSLYLVAYSRALSLCAAKAPETEEMVRFAEAARGAVVVERALHEGFFAKFGLTPMEVAATEPSPTCFAYTSFLLRTAAIEPYETLIAAVLPCFWIYQDVGTAIAAKAAPGNPYRAWIDTYADPDFAEATEAVKRFCDRAAAATTQAVRDDMMEAFRRSAVYEWMFWESAYRLEAWPID
jgi:thiaminase/transcriptional activator TenA